MIKYWFLQWPTLCGFLYGAFLLGQRDPWAILFCIGFGSFHVCTLFAIAGWHDHDCREAQAKGIYDGGEAEKSRAIYYKMAYFKVDPGTGRTTFIYGCWKCAGFMPEEKKDHEES